MPSDPATAPQPIEYVPEFADTFAVQRAALRYHFTARQRYFAWIPFGLFAGTLALIIYVAPDIERALRPSVGRDISFFGPIALMVLAAFAFVFGYTRLLAPRLAARWIKKRSAPPRSTFRADETGLSWSTELTHTTIQWPAVERVFVTPRGICFLVGTLTWFVPTRVVASAAAQRALVRFALLHLNPEARGLSLSDPKVAALAG